MKTTIELPEALFRKAKAAAAERGQSLKSFFTEAVGDAFGVVPGLLRPLHLGRALSAVCATCIEKTCGSIV